MPDSLPKSLSVLIVDDSSTILRWWRTVLSQIRGVNIVAEATRGQEALESVRQLRPDVILLDDELGSENGFDVLREIRKIDQTCFIVMVSTYRDIFCEKLTYRLGGNHYFAKFDPIEGLIEVLRVRAG